MNLRTIGPRRALACAAAGALLIASGSGGRAQSVISSPTAGYTGHMPVFRAGITNQLFTDPSQLEVREPFLQWGPLAVRPHFLYRFLYGDGVPASPTNSYTTAIHEIYPGMLLQLGNHWKLDYTPSLHYYSNRHFRDTLNHSAALDGSTTNGSWVLGLDQRYETASTPLIETKEQTDRENYTTALSAAYNFNHALSAELGFNQDLRYLGQSTNAITVNSIGQWSTLDWLNYQIWPQFGVALGAGLGYEEVSPGTNMLYEQFQTRLNWKPSERLAVVLSGGLEDRQFDASGTQDLLSPIFTAMLQYQLFEPTMIRAHASRSIGASILAGLVTDMTEVGGMLDQRLLHVLHLEVEGAYRATAYEDTQSTHAKKREDDRASISVRLRAPLFKSGTAAFVYEASDNSSSVSRFTLNSTLVGFELGYHF